MEIVKSEKHFQYKPNFFKIMKGVYSRDTFSIIPFFENCGMPNYCHLLQLHVPSFNLTTYLLCPLSI